MAVLDWVDDVLEGADEVVLEGGDEAGGDEAGADGAGADDAGGDEAGADEESGAHEESPAVLVGVEPVVVPGSELVWGAAVAAPLVLAVLVEGSELWPGVVVPVEDVTGAAGVVPV